MVWPADPEADEVEDSAPCVYDGVAIPETHDSDPVVSTSCALDARSKEICALIPLRIVVVVLAASAKLVDVPDAGPQIAPYALPLLSCPNCSCSDPPLSMATYPGAPVEMGDGVLSKIAPGELVPALSGGCDWIVRLPPLPVVDVGWLSRAALL